MNAEDKAWLIDEIISSAHFIGAEVRKDYSGRSMFGRRCLGIVGDFGTLFEVIQEVQRTITSEDIPVYLPVPDRDNMGFDEIWYWPGLRPEESEG